MKTLEQACVDILKLLAVIHGHEQKTGVPLECEESAICYGIRDRWFDRWLTANSTSPSQPETGAKADQ
jgi:hypothetical protein